MIGKATVLVLGLPTLGYGVWIASLAIRGYCLNYLIGLTQCGPSLYIHTVVGVAFFGFTLYLAHLWRD